MVNQRLFSAFRNIADDVAFQLLVIVASELPFLDIVDDIANDLHRKFAGYDNVFLKCAEVVKKD